MQKSFKLGSSHWLAHQFASSAYIEKRMFAEAAAEGRKAAQLSVGNTTPIALSAYALAKSGNQSEGRAELEQLLKLSSERYVSPYNIAMIYNGLGESDKAMAWLERGYDQRHSRMTFLKVEQKWDSLRNDARFKDLMRRIGFTP